MAKNIKNLNEDIMLDDADNDVSTNVVESNADADNTALMDHKQFDTFVKSTVTSFLTRYNLGKVMVDVGNGYKGVTKVNKNGEIEVEVTFKEII